jgi:hypothetical protein
LVDLMSQDETFEKYYRQNLPPPEFPLWAYASLYSLHWLKYNLASKVY